MNTFKDSAPVDYDPNDPKVYTNPEIVRQLDPSEQMVATINLAQTGQLVGGDNIRTLEAIMAAAGYDMVLDGQLSGEEQAALENFKRKLNDDGFKETAKELLEVIVGSPEEGKLQIPALAALLNPQPEPGEERAPARKQTIVSDPF